ncbi:MAG: hypothetical protein V7711_02200 [Pseudomonadales bacterium]
MTKRHPDNDGETVAVNNLVNELESIQNLLDKKKMDLDDIPVLKDVVIEVQQEQQLTLPPVEELDAQLQPLAAQTPHISPTENLNQEQWVEQAVQRCLTELEPVLQRQLHEIYQQMLQQSKKTP